MATSSDSLRQFMNGIGLEEGQDFDKLHSTMKWAHDIRLDRPNDSHANTPSVDDASAFYAACVVDKRIRKIVESSGLRWTDFKRSIGLKGLRDSVQGQKIADFNILESLRFALTIYKDQYKDREFLDALGLAYGVILSAEIGSKRYQASSFLKSVINNPDKPFNFQSFLLSLKELILQSDKEFAERKDISQTSQSEVASETLESELGFESEIGQEEVVIAKERISRQPANQETNVPTHTDNPAIVDQLGRQPFAEVIARRIDKIWTEMNAGSKDTKSVLGNEKFTVHIHGPWGSGKTSILNMICKALKNKELSFGEELNNEWVVVKFNAWKHQRMKPPWWSLIKELYKQSLPQLTPWSKREVTKEWWIWRAKADWTHIALALFLIAVVIYSLYGINSSDGFDFESVFRLIVSVGAVWGVIATVGKSLLFGTSHAAETFTKMRSDPLKPVSQLFKSLIEKIEKPVAIFIDDLDRCDKEYVVELVEGIQTVFKDTPVVYVIAADRNWIRASYEKVYEDFKDHIHEPGSPLGYLFLEKIFQMSVSVPQMSSEIQKVYWKSLVNAVGENGEKSMETIDTETEEEAQKIYKDTDPKTESDLHNMISNQTDPLLGQKLRAFASMQTTSAEFIERTEHMLEQYSDLVEPNPRSMKRLVNAYGIRQAVNLLVSDVKTEPLVMWTIIELRWPILAEILGRSPELISQIGKDRTEDSKVPEELWSLFESAEVKKVVDGKLNESHIREIIGLS